MASKRKPSLRLKRKEKKTLDKEIEFKGERVVLSLSSDLDVVLSALGLALMSLEDPRVDAILDQFGVVFYDKQGNKIGGEK